MTWELGQKFQNFDGLGLKIVILCFSAVADMAKKNFNAVGDSAKIV